MNSKIFVGLLFVGLVGVTMIYSDINRILWEMFCMIMMLGMAGLMLSKDEKEEKTQQ